MHGNDVIFRMMNKFFFLFLLIVIFLLSNVHFKLFQLYWQVDNFHDVKTGELRERIHAVHTMDSWIQTLNIMKSILLHEKTTAPRVNKWGFWNCWIPLESKSEWIILPLTYPSIIYNCLDVTMILIQVSPLSQKVFMPVFINKMFESIEIFKH